MGQPVKGFMTVKAEVRLPPGEQRDGVDYVWPTIERPARYVSPTPGPRFTKVMQLAS